MTKEIGNPLFGRLNLFYAQLQTVGKKVAHMRGNGSTHEDIDTELTYMGHLNRRLAEICLENDLDVNLLMSEGVEAVVSRNYK